MTRPAVLVVGGTGVLRDLAADLSRSAEVAVVGRRRAGPGSIAADLTIPCATVPGTWDAAVVYGPAVHPAVLTRLARAVQGPLVLLVTSAALERGTALQEAARTGAVPVLLGWTGPPDAPRWHSSAEIGAAAATALRERRPVRLGRFAGPRPD